MSQGPTYESLIGRFGDRYRWLAMSVVATGIVAAVLLSTSFSLAVPVLKQRFDVGHDEIQWVVTAFLVANTIAMLPSAWLIERYGVRRCFLVAVAVLSASVVFGALSPNFPVLIAMRIIQGAVAGLLIPIGVMVVMRLFPSGEQGLASGLLGFGVTIAPAVAPAFGGILIDLVGWQALLLMSLPFCALAWVGGVLCLPTLAPRDCDAFDRAGLCVLAGMTLALLLLASSASGLADAPGWPILGACLALLAWAWLWRHARAPGAIVTRDVLRERSVAMGVVVAFVYGFGAFWTTYLIPVLLQTLRGFSAAQAGILLLPSGLALAVALPVAGFLSDRIAPHLVVIAGILLYAASLVALWRLADSVSGQGIVLLTVLERIGVAFLLAPLNKVSLRDLQGRALGQAAMIVNYTRMLGGFFSIAILAGFVEARSARLGGSASAVAQAFGESFLLVAMVLGAALVAAWRMRA